MLALSQELSVRKGSQHVRRETVSETEFVFTATRTPFPTMIVNWKET